MTKSAQALADFGRAHPRVRELFWASLRRETGREHRVCQTVEEVYGVSPRGFRPLTQWDASWRRRARAYRIAEAAGWPESDLEAQRERLKAIPTEEYVPRLVGEDFRAGRMNCPLPDHEDRTPSFTVRWDNRWQCFGCGAKGDIYELAAHLWGLSLHGSGFLDLHERLLECFGGA